MVQYPTLHYSTLTPSFLCGLWGDGYTYAFSNMLSGLFLVSLKALNTESWCRRVNFMNSPQSAIMCSQKSRWMNGTERNNGNMSHSFYFWQHWVTVLGQIPYYKKHIISAGRKMSSAMSNCTGHRHFSSGCFYKVQGWHEAALLADTPHVGMLGIIRGSTLLWGMTPLMWRMLAWWGQQTGLLQTPHPELNTILDLHLWIRLQQQSRREPAVELSAIFCLCVFVYYACKLKCMHLPLPSAFFFSNDQDPTTECSEVYQLSLSYSCGVLQHAHSNHMDIHRGEVTQLGTYIKAISVH